MYVNGIDELAELSVIEWIKRDKTLVGLLLIIGFPVLFAILMLAYWALIARGWFQSDEERHLLKN